MPELPAPHVFISYSHGSDAHQDRVLALADRLRSDGIDAIVDQYVPMPPEGWPLWCEAEIDKADFVLMVCTERYFQSVGPRSRTVDDASRGLGVVWEARFIRQHLYDSAGASGKFVPVLFADGSDADVPTVVKGATIHRVDTERGYEALYRLLTGQHDTQAPPLGPRRAFPPRPRQHAADKIPQESGFLGETQPAGAGPRVASAIASARLAAAATGVASTGVSTRPAAAATGAASTGATAGRPPFTPTPVNTAEGFAALRRRLLRGGAGALAAGIAVLIAQQVYVSWHRYPGDDVIFPAAAMHRTVLDSPLLAVMRRHLTDVNLRLLVEEPPARQSLGAFFIDRVEVTNGEFRSFQADPHSGTSDQPESLTNAKFNDSERPVFGVSWKAADAYCRAHGKRLPTGDEWERAARGTDGRLYPWGDVFDPSFTNTKEGPEPAPVKVGTLPRDRSPDGVLDMAGNVREWTAEERQFQGANDKVVRGASWLQPGEISSLTFLKLAADPELKQSDIGFRCAADRVANFPPQPGMIAIDAGNFRKGSEDSPLLNLARKFRLASDSIRSLVAARPSTVTFRAFALDRYEVTNKQYDEFLEKRRSTADMPFGDLPSNKKSYEPNAQTRAEARLNQPNQPVVGVDWYDARAYCRWRDERLPSSDEWERAAGGFDGLAYPWGNNFETDRCNTVDSVNAPGATAEVGKYANCRSADGVFDLVGNADEWSDTKAPDAANGDVRIIRGGSWRDPGEVRGFTGFEALASAGYRGPDVGFRCAADPRKSWFEELAAWLF